MHDASVEMVGQVSACNAVSSTSALLEGARSYVLTWQLARSCGFTYAMCSVSHKGVTRSIGRDKPKYSWNSPSFVEASSQPRQPKEQKSSCPESVGLPQLPSKRHSSTRLPCFGPLRSDIYGHNTAHN